MKMNIQNFKHMALTTQPFRAVSKYHAAIRRQQLPSQPCRSALLGFSLVELLVASTVAAIIFFAIGEFLLAHMLQAGRIERSQRFREMANRINYLLAVEGSEASDVAYAPTVPAACSSSNAVGTSLFVLDVPRSTGQYASATNVSKVYYYNSSNGNLVRCGPLSETNGVLDHNLSLTGGVMRSAIVSRSTTLALLTSSGSSCNGEISNARQVAYSLSFAGSNYVPPCAVARAKTIFVCNPRLSSGAQEGDCP